MASERIMNGVKVSLERIAAGDSVRSATKAGGISVTSLYNNCTKKELSTAQKKGAEALLNKTEQPIVVTPPTTEKQAEVVELKPVKQKVIRRPRQPKREFGSPQEEIQFLKDRVAKLGSKLLDTILED